MSLELQPINQDEAFAFIDTHHSHHIAPCWRTRWNTIGAPVIVTGGVGCEHGSGLI